MRLYGHDIDETTTVLEADLEWILSWGKADFVGRDALIREKAAGPSRRLVGFELDDDTVAGHGDLCYAGDRQVGMVTSGARTPSIDRAIGLAYLPVDLAAPDSEFFIDGGGHRARARVVPLPFYKRPRG